MSRAQVRMYMAASKVPTWLWARAYECRACGRARSVHRTQNIKSLKGVLKALIHFRD
jgi:hypothetical protein